VEGSKIPVDHVTDTIEWTTCCTGRLCGVNAVPVANNSPIDQPIGRERERERVRDGTETFVVVCLLANSTTPEYSLVAETQKLVEKHESTTIILISADAVDGCSCYR
jgi:hypothetical protein